MVFKAVGSWLNVSVAPLSLGLGACVAMGEILCIVKRFHKEGGCSGGQCENVSRNCCQFSMWCNTADYFANHAIGSQSSTQCMAYLDRALLLVRSWLCSNVSCIFMCVCSNSPLIYLFMALLKVLRDS